MFNIVQVIGGTLFVLRSKVVGVSANFYRISSFYIMHLLGRYLEIIWKNKLITMTSNNMMIIQ